MSRIPAIFDWPHVRDLLWRRCERIGLGAAAGAAVLGLLVGAGMALRTTSPDGQMTRAVAGLDRRIDEAGKGRPGDEVALVLPEWESGGGEALRPGAWFNPGQVRDNYRRNPLVLPVARVSKDGVADFQMDVVAAPVFRYALQPEDMAVWLLPGGTAGTTTGRAATASVDLSGLRLVREVEARRLVVASAAFPYRAQLELFRKALQKERAEDLPPEDWPTFLGLNVLRWQVRTDGKQGEWEWVYGADAEGGPPVIKGADLRALLNAAVYDEANAGRLADVIVPGVPVTPLPLLAHGQYPPLRLAELKSRRPTARPPAGQGLTQTSGGLVKLPGPAAPVPPAGAAEPPGPPKQVSLEDLKAGGAVYEHLSARLRGAVYAFTPSGLPPAPAVPRGPGGPAAPPAGPKGPASVAPQGGPTAPAHCLVRFCDTDVRPGQTYVYAVQPRLANPNYQKPEAVAYRQLAEMKELPAPWVFTPPVTVPPDWDYYVVDQRYVPQSGGPWQPAPGSDLLPPARGQVAVQVHKWFSNFRITGGSSYPLGEWLVLERALLYRGDPVTRTNAPAAVPDWNRREQRFELSVLPGGKGKSAGPGLDFSPDGGGPPVVVDFAGGYQAAYRLGGRWPIRDDAEVELLVLAPDGTLRLRTNRVDADAESARGAERVRRWEAWRGRLDELRRAAAKALPGRRPGRGPPGVR